MTHHDQHSLEAALDCASPVPQMPVSAINSAAMAAFASKKPLMNSWTGRFAALAATVVLGFGGFMAMQSYQSHQKALVADADAFAEQLLSESF